MSQLMDQAISKVRRLPEKDQEAIASIILQEIEAEQRWEELFARPESEDLLSRMAAALSGTLLRPIAKNTGKFGGAAQ